MTDGIFLGVDGGGTKTEFICIDGSGKVIARAVTGTTYHLQVGIDEAVNRLRQGIRAVCEDLNITPSELDHSFFGLPAYGENTIVDPQLDAACARLLGHDRYLCGNDMICGWAGSLGCEDGINIVAGTGSIGYGEREGRSARAGGWGEIFSDEGSAYWIAVQGLALFSKMSDGRAPKGVLHERIVKALSLRDDLELCEHIMGTGGMARGDIAGLARIVSRAASEGDNGAAAILVSAAEELAAIACALRSRLGFPDGTPVLVSWSGGVLSEEPLVRRPLVATLESKGFDFVEPRFSPGHGAALYAKKRAHRLSLHGRVFHQTGQGLP
jgi:N-acetylglucosamine kinase-like BadF-type ATPase